MSDHDRVISSGAWMGAIVVSGFLAWTDTRIPHVCAWLLNTAVVLSACWGLAAWKRAWYAWLAFWGMAAVCAADGCLGVAGFDGSLESAMVWPVAVAYVTCWYWLVRAPRRQVPAPAQVIHVVHHGLPGTQVAVVPQSGSVTVPGRRVIAGRVIRAIESPASLPGAAITRQQVTVTQLPHDDPGQGPA